MQLPNTIEVRGIRVLTTRQLAEAYGTIPAIINNNFYRNQARYVLGKHYISVAGDEMKVLRTSHQNDGEFKRVSKAYLWTEKGALLHAKSLNTDKAWQVYDYLVDFYFRAKREVVPVNIKTEPVKEQIPKKEMQVDVPEDPKLLKMINKIRKDLVTMDVLLEDLMRCYSEKTYNEKVRAAASVVHIIVGDISTLLHAEPKLTAKG